MLRKLLGLLAVTVMMSQVQAATDYPSGYTKCVSEGSTCAMTGTRQVAFGKSGVFVYATITGSFTCQASLFPANTITGTRWCSYGAATSATVTPTPTTKPAATATPTPTTKPATTATPVPTSAATATPVPTTAATPTPTSVSSGTVAAPGVRTVPACTKVTVTSTIPVAAGETWDGLVKYGKWVCLVGSGSTMNGTQSESQIPVFQLASGATVQNVIIGDPDLGTGTNLAAGGADGIHCYGQCKVNNVYWGDIGEDAATLKYQSGVTGKFEINGGAAFKGADKMFQHNGDGEYIIKNFYATNIGKIYRSCGNCSTQYPRKVTVEGVTIGTLNSGGVGINSSYDSKSGIAGKYDVATISNVSYSGSKHLCSTYIGTGKGYEPVEDTDAANIARACIIK